MEGEALAWYIFCSTLLAIGVGALIFNVRAEGFDDLEREEVADDIAAELDDLALSCWSQAHNGELGERVCQAYQQAAGNVEAAAGLIRRAEGLS